MKKSAFAAVVLLGVCGIGLLAAAEVEKRPPAKAITLAALLQKLPKEKLPPPNASEWEGAAAQSASRWLADNAVKTRVTVPVFFQSSGIVHRIERKPDGDEKVPDHVIVTFEYDDGSKDAADSGGSFKAGRLLVFPETIDVKFPLSMTDELTRKLIKRKSYKLEATVDKCVVSDGGGLAAPARNAIPTILELDLSDGKLP